MIIYNAQADTTTAQSHFEDPISITQNGINVLGVPIGNEEWTKIQLNMMAGKYKEDLNKIVDCCTTQQVFKILQMAASCFQHIILSLIHI